MKQRTMINLLVLIRAPQSKSINLVLRIYGQHILFQVLYVNMTGKGKVNLPINLP